MPLPLLNPDEANIVPRAWDVVHGGGLDPGWYDYPSLLFVLLAPAQAALDEPSYGAARVVAVVLGVLGVAAAWWLGRGSVRDRRRPHRAPLAVAVATTHVAYSRMAVTDVLLDARRHAAPSRCSSAGDSSGPASPPVSRRRRSTRG